MEGDPVLNDDAPLTGKGTEGSTLPRLSKGGAAGGHAGAAGAAL